MPVRLAGYAVRRPQQATFGPAYQRRILRRAISRAGRAKKELDEYFCGSRKSFDIPIRAIGTDFQKRVWQALLEIPYGETRSYKEIALRANCPKGARAVAGAVGANAISILIPCHRIIGTNGSLTGFARASRRNGCCWISKARTFRAGNYRPTFKLVTAKI